jgi:hypothetical protein
MLKIQQDLLAVVDDRVLAAAGDIEDGPDAAGIVLEPGIIEALGLGCRMCHALGIRTR